MEREPSLQESPKQKLIAELRRLKTEWRGGIPDETIHSTLIGDQKEKYPDTKFKVRKAWFHVVGSVLTRIIRSSYDGKALISQSLLNEVIAYHRTLTTPSEFHQQPTTQEDIDKAEAIMDKVIAELEK